ncbi:MAG: hypothetical protein V4617_15050 [Gemmatimonadota bacterium]
MRVSAVREGDSVKVTAQWKPVKDGKGDAEAYQVTYSGTGLTSITHSVKHPAVRDSAWYPLPAFGATQRVDVSVVASRRGKSSIVRTASVTVTNPDAPPPPVDSLIVDTLPKAISSIAVVGKDGVARQFAYTQTTFMAEGDSLLLVRRHPAGQPRAADDTTRWSADPALFTMRPVKRGLQDSVWVIGAPCNCVESRRQRNRPQLRSADGQLRYQVRDGEHWRDVTPLASDPFTPARGT